MKKTNIVINKTVNGIKSFMRGESGSHTVEVLVVLGVLVGLALIFREQIVGLLKTFIDNIFSDANSALGF